MCVYVRVLPSARQCVPASMRACVRACVRACLSLLCSRESVSVCVRNSLCVFLFASLNTVSVFFGVFACVYKCLRMCVCVRPCKFLLCY